MSVRTCTICQKHDFVFLKCTDLATARACNRKLLIKSEEENREKIISLSLIAVKKINSLLDCYYANAP